MNKVKFNLKRVSSKKILSIGLIFISIYALMQIISYRSSSSIAGEYLISISVLSVIPSSLVLYYLQISSKSRIKLDYRLSYFILVGAFSMILAGELNKFAITNSNLESYSIGFFYLLIGPLEEISKLLSIKLGTLGKDKFYNAIEYAVIGGIVAIGFSIGENIFYLIESPAPVDTGIMRVHTSVLHMVLGVFLGFALGKAKESKSLIKFFTLASGLIIVILLHGTYNTIITKLGVEIGLLAFYLITSIIIIFFVLMIKRDV